MEGKENYTKVRYATPDGRYLTEEEYAAFVEQCSNPTIRQGPTTSSPIQNTANLVEAIDALQRHNDSQTQRVVMTEARPPPESNLQTHGNHSVKSAVEELLNLQLEDMQSEVGGSSELLANIVNALNATQERCAILEENQKVLEENQRSLQSQLQAAYTLNEQLLSLWDLSRHDIENTQLVTNPQQKVSLLHSTPALYTIITRFNSMADTVNALVDKVEEVEMAQQKVISNNTSYVTSSAPIQSVATIGSTTTTHPSTPVLTPQHINNHLINGTPQTRQIPSQPTTPHSNSASVTNTASSSNVAGLAPGAKRPLVGLEISDGGDVEGVRVVSVKVGGPGHKAGLQEGDYIVNFNGWNVNTRDEFRAVITKALVGVPLNITYIKAGTGNPIRSTITLLESTSDNSGSISRSATPTPTEPSARIVTRNPSLPMSPQQMRAPVGDMNLIAGGPGQLMMSPKQQMLNPHMINPALAISQGRILY